jgi:pimeloyl-ACP methyl ester carboxylesterase
MHQMAWAPTLPSQTFINGLNHIPPPSVEAFESEFAGILPEGTSLPSCWGVTRFYDFSPDATASARRVLLIHGIGTSAIGIAPLALRLKATGSHVVIYDLWGHGLSSTPITPHVPAIFHTQIFELLSYLKWSKAHIFGFSGGGSIAATFVALHPQCAESLILAVPAGWMKSSDYPWWFRAVYSEGWWGLYWARRRTVLGFVIGFETRPKPDWKERLQKGEVDMVAVQLWERAHHKGHERSVISTFEGTVLDQHDKFAMLPKSGVEVLLILGEKDDAVKPMEVREVFSKMGWVGDIHEIAGAGHDVVRPYVDETAGLMDKFWAKLGV